MDTIYWHMNGTQGGANLNMNTALEQIYARVPSFNTVTIIIKSRKIAKLKTTMFSNKLLIYCNSVICIF